MDIIFFCRNGLYDSLIATFNMAMSANESGKKAGIILTGDALNSLCGGILRWPDSLKGIQHRKTILKEAKNMGLPLAGEIDPREIDLKPLIEKVKESGVRLYACPTWTSLLGLGGRLPGWLREIEMERLLDEIMSCKKVIGGL